jgi:hypothetical protein
MKMQYQTICAWLCAALIVGSTFADIAEAASAKACDAYARDYANNASRQGQILRGGAVGTLAGAGVGAIFGAAGIGAAVVGGLGVIGGGRDRRETARGMYQAAYQDCMAGRL